MIGKGFARNEKAVSPVIGVILMVAITVILAAVIASFVFGLGAKAPKSAPQAQLALSDHTDSISTTGMGGDNVLTISHQGGDALTTSNMKIYVFYRNDSSIDSLSFGSENYFNGSSYRLNSSNTLTDGRFDPGDVLIIEEASNWNIASGDIIKVKVMDTISNQPILDGQVQVW